MFDALYDQTVAQGWMGVLFMAVGFILAAIVCPMIYRDSSKRLATHPDLAARGHARAIVILAMGLITIMVGAHYAVFLADPSAHAYQVMRER